ncbi:MAG: hypothetical protein L0J17_00125 [Brevibacterium sp.]|uniref:hypothetical protein n=1 Tax=Brevibacterium sp. TaxID=1701 RepID=UPI002649E1C4|nr:hypothetical protein [Brevibacterium sp.]MDN5806908.1 hypothetical protein [Brevibacterium sp.]MDN5833762.1 hypothetical protein [Brevibacterium sp.]MDN5876942.1 hypothetical protein [Brevibacterium sp.]MDN5907999.1 hypothetical protein [Brevibacterium sp.]MDN6156644.1 hypothetical protein [Brevibacterium sp.]
MRTIVSAFPAAFGLSFALPLRSIFALIVHSIFRGPSAPAAPPRRLRSASHQQ